MAASLLEIQEHVKSKIVQDQSIEIIRLLKLMGARPTPEQKNALSLALNKCTAFSLDAVKPVQRFLAPSGGSHNNLGLSNQDFQHLYEALNTNETITYLDLSNNEIDNNNALALANVLTQNRTLTYLDLSGNRIHSDDVFSRLVNNTSLIHLDLNSNWLWVDGLHINNAPPLDIPQLTEILKTNTTLKSLILAVIPLSTEGIQRISNILPLNKKLIHLDLSFSIHAKADRAFLVNTLQSMTHHVPRPPIAIFGYKPIEEACLDYAKACQNRDHEAYKMGRTLQTLPLLPDITNIVASYLNYEGPHFSAGLQKKPKPKHCERTKKQKLWSFTKKIFNTLSWVPRLLLISFYFASGVCFVVIGAGEAGIFALAIGLALLVNASLELITLIKQYQNQPYLVEARDRREILGAAIAPPVLCPTAKVASGVKTTVALSNLEINNSEQKPGNISLKRR